MEIGDWRSRLEAALTKSGKSMRSVSLGAGMGPGYLHSILKGGKDPTIDNLVAVCREIGVSLSWVLYGLEISPETEEILRELEASSPLRRQGLLQFLRDETAQGPEPSER